MYWLLHATCATIRCDSTLEVCQVASRPRTDYSHIYREFSRSIPITRRGSSNRQRLTLPRPPFAAIPPRIFRHILSYATSSYRTHGLDSPVDTCFVFHISDISGHSLTVPCGSPVSDRHHTPVCPSIPALTPFVRHANTACPKTSNTPHNTTTHTCIH